MGAGFCRCRPGSGCGPAPANQSERGWSPVGPSVEAALPLALCLNLAHPSHPSGITSLLSLRSSILSFFLRAAEWLRACLGLPFKPKSLTTPRPPALPQPQALRDTGKEVGSFGHSGSGSPLGGGLRYVPGIIHQFRGALTALFALWGPLPPPQIKDSRSPSICHLFGNLSEIRGLGPTVLGVWTAGARCLGPGISGQLLASRAGLQTVGVRCGGEAFPLHQQLCFARRPGVSSTATAKRISLDAICLQFVNPAGDALQT